MILFQYSSPFIDENKPRIKIGISNNKINGKNIEKSFKKLLPLLSLFKKRVNNIMIKRKRRIKCIIQKLFKSLEKIIVSYFKL